jgi:hypothetical protein
MRHIKKFDTYQINEEESVLRNLLLSAALSIGLNYADAQTIETDSMKTEVVKDISNFNKTIVMTGDLDDNYRKLTDELSKKLNDPELFVDKYLFRQSNGTLIVNPNFVEGLELHLRRNLILKDYEDELRKISELH